MNEKKLIFSSSVGQDFEIDDKKQTVLSGVDFSVSGGEFVCIVGPSGCGKSTLLRILSGIIPPTSGEVKIDNDVRLAMVFQNFALFPWLSVFENVAFGPKMKGLAADEVEKIAKEKIQMMGLFGVEKKHPKELSGGMKQRVGIARALAVNPNVLFLDEPFSALDVFTAKKLRAELLEIWQREKLTVVMISHLIEEAVELSDRICVMSANPGRISHVAPNDLPRPRNKRSAEFFQLVDKLEAMIDKNG
ncbi:MAG: ABC transporter ATP-binding protein [Candidatus Berkelbacteria bacterium]|nr:ABC transporter ATP-binding protein [Candidatus Berkelbacteria bacterium]